MDINTVMAGRYCLVVNDSYHIHFGEVVFVDGDKVLLKNSKRINGSNRRPIVGSERFLNQMANVGIITEYFDIDETAEEIYLCYVTEIIPCSPMAQEIIQKA